MRLMAGIQVTPTDGAAVVSGSPTLTKRPHFLGILHGPRVQSFRVISYGFLGS